MRALCRNFATTPRGHSRVYSSALCSDDRTLPSTTVFATPSLPLQYTDTRDYMYGAAIRRQHCYRDQYHMMRHNHTMGSYGVQCLPGTSAHERKTRPRSPFRSIPLANSLYPPTLHAATQLYPGTLSSGPGQPPSELGSCALPTSHHDEASC